jgi:hypothetical protein
MNELSTMNLSELVFAKLKIMTDLDFIKNKLCQYRGENNLELYNRYLDEYENNELHNELQQINLHIGILN